MKMIQNLENDQTMQELFNKGLEDKEQIEISNKIIELYCIEKFSRGIKSRRNEAEKWINDLEDRVV